MPADSSPVRSAHPARGRAAPRSALAILGAALAIGSGVPLAPVAQAALARTLHVATTGTSTGDGSAARPFATVQRGADVARPGDTILVHQGTYRGVVIITRSGTQAQPITLTSAGDGPVTLTADFRSPPCDAHAPALDRTIQVLGGADYWTVSHLNIVNGITVKGANGSAAMKYLTRLVNTGDWQARRRIPGRGSKDPVAAASAFDYLSAKTGVTINPSDGLRFVGNTITRRGIHIIAARYGEVRNNDIGPVDCGIGPGVWVNVFSDGWTVAGNHIHDIAASTFKHYMQEGIRLGSATSYAAVRNNLVEHLPGDGRAMNTDVDASWNTFRNNRANDVAMGYNDQMSGWGNVWDHNVASNFRVWGLNFRGIDASLPQPSLNSSTYLAVVTCNTALGGPTDPMVGGGLHIGAAKSSTFANNTLSSAVLGDPVNGFDYVRQYWGQEGNTWDGQPTPPPLHPAPPPPGTCG
ncbi:MAG TPA: hypothetical protein VFJ97_00915 [Dermatophilaceae bacterium]|nr:hypothetical protein [Dermatophilaceae bacterium]